MKRSFCAGMLAFACLAVPVRADNIVMSVRATLPYVNFVVGEQIPLTVTLTNPGSTTFIIDDYPPHDKNSFQIFLRNTKGRIALPVVARSFLPDCTLRPGESMTFTVNINEYFDVTEEGRYQVSAAVQRGADSANSRTVPFMMVRGIEMGSVRRMKAGSDNVALEYTLSYWARNEREYLFLRIIELPEKRPYGFVNLGTVVRIAEPRIEFETDQIVAVTHQTARDNFQRTRIDITRAPVRILDSRLLRSAVAIQEDKIIQRARDRLERVESSNPTPPREGFLRRTPVRNP